MKVIQFSDDKSYGDALFLLHYEIFGTFRTLPDRKLVVGERQYEALVKAGVVDANGEPPKGKKNGKPKRK